MGFLLLSTLVITFIATVFLLFFINQKYFLVEQGQIPSCIDVATCLGNVNIVQDMCIEWNFDICTCKYNT